MQQHTTLMNTTTTSNEFAAFIGIDWASQEHALCLYDCATAKREASTLAHTPEAIAQWAQGLEQRFAGKKIALCLEQSRGPLVYALLEYAQTRQLCGLLQHRRTTVDLRTLLTNMLRDALKSYYPQALALAGQDLFAPLGCQFLLQWPSLQELQKARKESVRKFYYAHNCRRMDVIEKRLDSIAQMIPLCRDSAVLDPAKVQVKMLARQLLQLGLALKEYDSRIAQLFAEHRDASIWQSLPGAGPTLAPRLCCAFGTQRSRYESATAIQQYSGVAPVTEKSGKNQHWIHRRWARPHFIHQSFFEYAGQSALHCQWAKLYLKEQTARGKTHSSAVRALAFKWQRIMFVCWRDRVPYDETIYLKSLKRRGSPLTHKLDQTLLQAA